MKHCEMETPHRTRPGNLNEWENQKTFGHFCPLCGLPLMLEMRMSAPLFLIWFTACLRASCPIFLSFDCWRTRGSHLARPEYIIGTLINAMRNHVLPAIPRLQKARSSTRMLCSAIRKMQFDSTARQHDSGTRKNELH